MYRKMRSLLQGEQAGVRSAGAPTIYVFLWKLHVAPYKLERRYLGRTPIRQQRRSDFWSLPVVILDACL